MSTQKKILIVAAEASSAAYASWLLKSWKSSNLPIHAFGIGSREMESLGFEIIGRSEELAVVGLQEIIAHWGDIKGAFHRLIDKAEEYQPDLVLLMDYPEFNLRLAQKLKSKGFRIAYYISPQIWAWRTYRVHKIKRLVDHMFVIFPFEDSFYKKHGVPSTFVGHPLLDLMETSLPTDEVVQETRDNLFKEHTNKNKILGLMPGSRRSELKHNLQTQIASAVEVVSKDSSILPVVFVAPSLDMDFVKSLCATYSFQGAFLQEDPFKMIRTADVILCASGTATLMVGLCRRPMVIMYKMNKMSGFLARFLVRHISFFGMVNLIMEKEIVPERFQQMANPQELAKLLLDLFHNKNGQRDIMLKEYDHLREKLGSRGGLDRLSQGILQMMGWS
ncbi:MAG: lipid-A-disaccharide synthase [Bdellovibrionaceae bacterium]|nr:lipid-A-disaccharide synthase [Pseudobdellovibrionaceae bacterium]